LWHTGVLILILAALALAGALAQRHAPPGSHLVAGRPAVLPLYLSLILAELALLRYTTRAGPGRERRTVSALLGERWSRPGRAALDLILAAAVLWLAAVAIPAAVHLAFHLQAGKSVDTLLPRSPAESVAWLALSLAAGFCEETVFRGYLLRQLRALTGRPLVAVVLQAAAFGLAHAYQGTRAVAEIVGIGLLFGLVAWWRKSLIPVMLAHAAMDIAAGLLHWP
jgi:membrane protease YdiL (CAAX protease family)